MSWQEESTWKHVIDKHKGGRGDEKKKKKSQKVKSGKHAAKKAAY